MSSSTNHRLIEQKTEEMDKLFKTIWKKNEIEREVKKMLLSQIDEHNVDFIWNLLTKSINSFELYSTSCGLRKRTNDSHPNPTEPSW